MQELSSLHNEKIKYLKSLQQKKYRKMHGCYLIEGKRLLAEALERGAEITAVAVEKDRMEAFSELLAQVEGAELLVITPAVLRALCLTEAPEGIVACVKMKQCGSALTEGSLMLILDGLQDPGNVGTILRTANACGVKDIYLSANCVELYNPKVVRSAMGALFTLNIRQECDLEALIPAMQADGRSVLGTSLCGENYYDGSFSGKVGLVIGNEGNGVSESVLRLCDKQVKLPVSDSAESLNAAMAAGILLYDLMYRNKLQ